MATVKRYWYTSRDHRAFYFFTNGVKDFGHAYKAGKVWRSGIIPSPGRMSIKIRETEYPTLRAAKRAVEAEARKRQRADRCRATTRRR